MPVLAQIFEKAGFSTVLVTGMPYWSEKMGVPRTIGAEFPFGHQLGIVFTLMLTSKGVAGVPRATLVILLGTAASFGLPEWPILAILGIDELMDMARTSVNVIGNCLATVVIARWEGEFKEAPQSSS